MDKYIIVTSIPPTSFQIANATNVLKVKDDTFDILKDRTYGITGEYNKENMKKYVDLFVRLM